MGHRWRGSPKMPRRIVLISTDCFVVPPRNDGSSSERDEGGEKEAGNIFAYIRD